MADALGSDWVIAARPNRCDAEIRKCSACSRSRWRIHARAWPGSHWSSPCSPGQRQSRGPVVRRGVSARIGDGGRPRAGVRRGQRHARVPVGRRRGPGRRHGHPGDADPRDRRDLLLARSLPRRVIL